MSKVSEISLQVDNRVINLEKLRALMWEISSHFDEEVEPNSIGAMNLINNVDHVSLLLSLALDVVQQEISALTNIVNDGMAASRAEKPQAPAVLEGAL